MFFEQFTIKLSYFNSLFELFATFNFAYSALEPVKLSINKNIANTILRVKNDAKNLERFSVYLRAVNYLDTTHFNNYFNNRYGYSLEDIIKGIGVTEYSFLSFVRSLGVECSSISELNQFVNNDNSDEANSSSVRFQKLSRDVKGRFLPIFFYFGFYSLVLLFIAGVIDSVESKAVKVQNFLYAFLAIFDLASIFFTLILMKRQRNFISIFRTVLILFVIITCSIFVSYFIAESTFLKEFLNRIHYSRNFTVLFSIFTVATPLFFFFLPPFLKSVIIVVYVVISVRYFVAFSS